MLKRDNNINPALQKMPDRSSGGINRKSFYIRIFASDCSVLTDEETIPGVIQPNTEFTSGSPFTVIPSRASSRLSSK